MQLSMQMMMVMMQMMHRQITTTAPPLTRTSVDRGAADEYYYCVSIFINRSGLSSVYRLV